MIEEHKHKIEMAYDSIRLHTMASLGHAKLVPNLETGEVESITLIEFAHLVDPPLSCPSCGEPSSYGAENNSAPSLVILSVSGQCSYLCESCWMHSKIPFFGVHTQGEDGS